MNTQPEALALADWIKETDFYDNSDMFINDKMDEVEATLRDLYSNNASLLAALKVALNQNQHDMVMTGEECRGAEAAIAKVTGESK